MMIIFGARGRVVNIAIEGSAIFFEYCTKYRL